MTYQDVIPRRNLIEHYNTYMKPKCHGLTVVYHNLDGAWFLVVNF